MNFTLTQILNFIEVVEWGNISKAASHLNIAQPALSRQIKALEESLGSRLLLRQSWGVEVTEEGRAFLEYALRIRKECQAADEALRDSGKEPMGTVYLGLPSAYSVSLVPRLIKDIRVKYPKIDIRIVTAFSGTIYEWLLSGRLDLALLYHSEDHLAAESFPLFEEPLLVVGKRGRFKADSPVELDEIARSEQTIVPWRPHILRLVVEQMYHDRQLAFSPAFEIDSMPCIKELIKEGLGVTFLPRSAVHKEVADNVLSATNLNPDASLQIYVGMAPNRQPSGATKTIAQNLQTVAADLSGETGWTLLPA